MRVALLSRGRGWHTDDLQRALAARGHVGVLLPITHLAGRLGPASQLDSAGQSLDDFDVVLVRLIPRGSLEQLIFRLDALHLLAARAVRVVNSPTALERTVDKYYTSGLLAQAGLPTPRTLVCESRAAALAAFAELGRDVIVKPLFGSMGLGLARLQDEAVAYRVFQALELERAVYYVQETIPHPGRDLRAFVIGGQVVAAMARVAPGWRTNLAQGARPEPVNLTPEQTDLCLRAAAAVGADYAGVDLLPAADGSLYVLEVNGIPGWQGLRQVTPVDIAARLVAHLESA
ncbi:MAG: RimK family alpha-L-glutamate ligase [Anaerolineales bacterium]|nr:RimK family alpha-L-glutamate ligase [Anaerolineales bacterium]